MLLLTLIINKKFQYMSHKIAGYNYMTCN